MGLSPVRGPRRHRGEEVNDGSVLVLDARSRKAGSCRPGRHEWGGGRLDPSPHASSKEERESASRLERQSLPESGHPLRLVLLDHVGLRRGLLDGVFAADRSIFFPPKARSIVLG